MTTMMFASGKSSECASIRQSVCSTAPKTHRRCRTRSVRKTISLSGPLEELPRTRPGIRNNRLEDHHSLVTQGVRNNKLLTKVFRVV
jgi:hypothetical protein